MFFLYSFLLAVGFLVFLPRFIFQKKYAASFRERLGHLPDFDAEGRPVVWLHSVSVGETQAARPLVKELLENFPEYKLVVSTTTLTGQRLAKEIFAADAALVFYFPFDFRFAVRRALRKIQPGVVLLMETELWLNFLREASRSGAKIAIVNGRLSGKSASRYGWIPKTMRRVLRYVDLALMQTAADAERLTSLGISSTKVNVTGNVKFDQPLAVETENRLTGEFRERFAFSAPDAPLIVAASTHAPEEKWILDAFRTIYKSSPTGKPPRLMLVPRHPERFAEVAQMIKNSGFDWARRSEKPSPRDKTAEIILLDSIGELRAVYPLAEIVFVGGSLIPHGGQSVLEPAAAQKPIVTGFYTMNFEKIVREFLENEALLQLPQLDEKEIPARLAQSFSRLLENPPEREKLAANAFRVMQSNRGASRKTIEYLKPIFKAQNKIN
ncbi:MAG: 3-deoxy-D-manno-octulosonic acid transferase [Acidobacteriota bacterium]|nr:3-deoxy-D-manno-octulosonic acid transferase [Acidobacteriota bacterium]